MSRSENSKFPHGKARRAYKSKFATNLLLFGFLEGHGGLSLSTTCLSPPNSPIRDWSVQESGLGQERAHLPDWK